MKILIILVVASIMLFSCQNFVETYKEDIKNSIKLNCYNDDSIQEIKDAEKGQELNLVVKFPLLNTYSRLRNRYSKTEIKEEILTQLKDGKMSVKLVIKDSETQEKYPDITIVDKLGNFQYIDTSMSEIFFKFNIKYTMQSSSLDIYVEIEYEELCLFTSHRKTFKSKTITLSRYDKCKECEIKEFIANKPVIFNNDSVILKWKTKGNCNVYLRNNNQDAIEEVYNGNKEVTTGGRYDLFLKCNNKEVGNTKTLYIDAPDEGLNIDRKSNNKKGFKIHSPGLGESHICDKKSSMKIFEIMIDTTAGLSVQVYRQYFKYGELKFGATNFSINSLTSRRGEFYDKYKAICGNIYTITQKANSAIILIQGFADNNVPKRDLLIKKNSLSDAEDSIYSQDSVYYFDLHEKILREGQTPFVFDTSGVTNEALPYYRAMFLRNFLIANSEFGMNKNLKKVPIGILKGEVISGGEDVRTVRLFIITTKEEICLENLTKYFK